MRVEGECLCGACACEAGVLSLRVGPLAQRRTLKPSAQLWCRSKLDWLDELASVPGMATQPGVTEAEGEGA